MLVAEPVPEAMYPDSQWILDRIMGFSQVPSPAVNAVTWAERLNAWCTVDFTLAQGLMIATKQTQPLSYPTTSLTFSESQVF